MKQKDAFMPAASPVRRTRLVSWAPSGWFVRGNTVAIDTDFVTLCCPDEFVAVRAGFTNIHEEPYIINKVIAAASTTLSDGANPTGNTVWTPLTFANGGANAAEIVASADAPTRITVHGCRPDTPRGTTGIPRWTWTDWTPLASVARTDSSNAPRVLMLRVLLPAGCKHTRPNGGFLEYHATPAMNLGFDYVAGHVPADIVTAPATIYAPAAGLGQSNPPVSCIQFLTRNAGIVGMTTGDSHHQGTSTTTQFWNYLLRATVKIGAQHIGRIPFGYWSTARGGSGSEWFFSSLTNVLDVAKPSFVVLPGWTFNDMSGSVHADQAANDAFLARLLMTSEACVSNGAVPIFLTPFPRDAHSMNEEVVRPWLKLRRFILSMRDSGAIVVDATQLLGARSSSGEFDGCYLPQYTSDQVHPNDAGHAALAKILGAEIEKLIDDSGTN